LGNVVRRHKPVVGRAADSCRHVLSFGAEPVR
jgi:hypothetical protein